MRQNYQSIVRALQRSESVRERFWASVSMGDAPESCWEWIGSIKPGSHPAFSVSHFTIAAPRVAWFMETGELPAGGHVRQLCANPLCVRPSHLSWHVGRRTECVLNAMNDGYVRIPQRAEAEDEAA